MVISSGIKATEEIKDHLLNAESYGKSVMDKFVEKRLSEKFRSRFFRFNIETFPENIFKSDAQISSQS